MTHQRDAVPLALQTNPLHCRQLLNRSSFFLVTISATRKWVPVSIPSVSQQVRFVSVQAKGPHHPSRDNVMPGHGGGGQPVGVPHDDTYMTSSRSAWKETHSKTRNKTDDLHVLCTPSSWNAKKHILVHSAQFSLEMRLHQLIIPCHGTKLEFSGIGLPRN